jgi:hypothetical protein
MTSKRKLKAMVDEGIVTGWDDPRMPTLAAGMRRRGYTPESIRKMAADTGASKTNIWIDYSVLDIALRDDLEGKAARAMAVLDPLPLKLTNWAEVFGSDAHREPCQAPGAPAPARAGPRQFELGPLVWIERDDFEEVPPKGFFRLFPGNKVRLKYGLVIECTGCEKDAAGAVTAVLATVVPDTKSGTPGADASRSRAPSPGWRSTTRCRPSCGCSSACSPPTSPRKAAATSATTSTRTASACSRVMWNRRWPAWPPTRGCSSSATATSWPTARTTRPAGRCSTAWRR